MLLRLPISLRRAVLGSMSVFISIFSSTASMGSDEESWQVVWPSDAPTLIDQSTTANVAAAIAALGGGDRNVRITSAFSGASGGSLLSSKEGGSSYLDIEGTWINTDAAAIKYLNIVSGGNTKTGDLYCRFSEGGLITTGTAATPGTVYQGAVIISNNVATTGDLYVEFNSSGMNIEGRTLIAGSAAAIVGTWGAADVNGSMTMVYKKGSFGFSGNTGTQGMILAGGYNGGAAASGSIRKSTFIEIEGGTFYGAIVGGGHRGNVAVGETGAGTNILIKGGTISGNIYGGSVTNGNVGSTEFANGTNIRIDGTSISASNPLAISGSIYGASRDAGIVYGDTNITLSNFDQAKLASFAAGVTFNGGSQGAGTVSGEKILTFDKVTGDIGNVFNNFDRIIVKEGTDVGLTHADSATALNNINILGDGNLALKVAGAYQFSLSHTGGKGGVNASSPNTTAHIFLGKTNVGDALSMGSLNLSTGTLTFDLGKSGAEGSFDTLALATMSSIGQIDITINAWELTLAAREYVLITGDITGVDSFILTPPAASGRQTWDLVRDADKLTLKVTGEAWTPLTWAGGSTGTWSTNTENTPWNDGAGSNFFAVGDSVNFTTLEGVSDSVITLEGALKPLNITVSGTTNYTWEGAGSLQGSADLDKSGDGTLTIGTNNVDYTGKVTLRGGVLELASINALGRGSLVFNGGTLKYGDGVTQDVSSLLGGVTEGNDNTIRVDTNGNNVVWNISRGAYAYTKLGEGILTIKPGNVTTFSSAITVNQGSLDFDTSAGNVTLSGILTGGGDLIKTGGNNLFITSNSNDFGGVLDVKNGLVVVGAAATNLGGKDAKLGAGASIVIGKGGSFRTHLGGGTAGSLKAFDFVSAYVKSGGAMGNIDGHASWNGQIAFNVDTIGEDGTITYDASGSATLYQYYAKKVVLNGVVSGAGIVNWVTEFSDAGGAHIFALANAGNTFSGIYNLSTAHKSVIDLAAADTDSGGVASKASVVLKSANSSMVLSGGAAGSTISLVNIDSSTGTSITATNGAKTLAINDTKDNIIAGSLGDTTNLITLEKKGDSKLTISGTIAKGTVVKAISGVLQLGDSATYATDAQITIGGAASFDFGGIGLASTLTLSNLTLEDGSRLVMDVGPGVTSDKLVYTGVALGGTHALDITILGTAEVNEYVLIDSTSGFDANFNVGTWVPTSRGMQGGFILRDNQLILNITSAGAAGNIVWNGNAGSHTWEAVGDSTNWTGGTDGDNYFYNADSVQFTNEATNKEVSIRGKVSPSSLSVTADGYSFVGSGSIIGSGALTMNAPAGTLKINTSNADWTGNIELNAGIIEFGKNGLGKGKVTMANDTMLTWGKDNNQTLGTITASGELVKLNSGANIIGTQVVDGTYTTLEKLGSGTIALSISGSSTLRVSEGVVNLVAASKNNAYYVGKGSTLNVNTQAETSGNISASLVMDGGILNLGTVNNTYFGGKNIRFTDKSSIISDASCYWRLEGDGASGVLFTVEAAASGSSISVADMRLTRTNNAIVFNVEDGDEVMDLSISSKITAQIGGERFQKKGNGTILFTGSEAVAGVGLLLDEGKFQIGNAKNGNTSGVWNGALTVAAGAEFAIDKTDDLILSGTNGLIAGAGTINILNQGKVTLSNGTHTFSGKMILAGGGILDMADKAMGAGASIDIYSGSLDKAGSFAGTISIDQSKGGYTPTVIDLGGARGSGLVSIKGAADVAKDKVTQVTNIGNGNITLNDATSVLGISSSMVSSTAGSGDSIFSYTTGADNNVTINGNLSIKLTDAAASALIKGIETTQYLNVTNGKLNLGTSTGKSFESPYHIFQSIFRLGNAEGGSLAISSKEADKTGWLIVSGDDPAYTIDRLLAENVLSGLKGIYNDGTITLSADSGDISLNNLEGASQHGVINTVAGNTVSLLNNGITASVYHGSISGGADIIKGGTDYHMTIGRLNLTNGASLSVEGGSLTINTGGEGSTSLIDGDLVLESSGRFILGESHVLTINGTIDSQLPITRANEIDAPITLHENSVLKLGTGFELGVGVAGKGTLSILTGTFSLGSGGSLGDDLILSIDRNAIAQMVDGDSFGALSGAGTLNLDGGTLELKNAEGTFSGTFTGSNGTINHSGSGTQTFVSGGNQTLSINQSGTGKTILKYETGTANYDSVIASAGSLETLGSISTKNTTIGSGVHLVIGSDAEGAVRTTLHSVNTKLAGGSQITLNGINRDTVDITSFNAGAVTHTGDEATIFNLSTRGDWTDASYTINLMEGTNIEASDYEAILMGALKNLGYSIVSVVNEEGTLKALLQSSGSNGLLGLTNSHNTIEAANSLWYSRVESPVEGGTLRSIIDTLINAGSGAAGDLTEQQATAALASYAGSSVTSLFSAQRDSLYQQVKWIRNRTAQMGVNPEYVNEEMPYFNAWIQGNGGYNRIDQQGDQAGYTLDTWGGTAGVDVDLSEKLTVGAAFTASYNKIRTNSYDSAKGRDDAYYANLFARLQHKRWAHTLIITGGTNDANLNRTVSIGDTQYYTNGSTSGSSLGAFYEGTYDVLLNKKGTSILQPLFNASIYRSQLDGYTETGMGDASMKVDERDATYGRVGLGARLMGIVGSNVLGRGVLGEVRVQVVQDYGDETHTATISPLGATTSGLMNVRGAEVGRTGAQIGAGLSIPMGEKGSIYVDVDAEFRSKATVLSGNLGYRINF